MFQSTYFFFPNTLFETNNTPLENINVDGLEVGVYVFSILVIDDVGNLLTDEVTVSVLPEIETSKDEDGAFDFLTLPGVDTDLRGPIEENPLGFAIFTGLLISGVLGSYFYLRKKKLAGNEAGTMKKPAKKSPKKVAKKAAKKTSKKASKKKKT